MKWCFLLINIVFSILSSVLVKISTISQTGDINTDHSVRFANNKFFWLGFFFYATSFFSYIMVVAQFPLQIAQTIVTAAIIIIITFISSFVWHEPFDWKTGMGIILITIGIALISFCKI
ncbi:hypothetical protein HUT03_01125 [Candidatus Liberibacter africanus]|uniref:Putative transmembrane protein n=1 Tax=Candidatus Liberibacter africanus PTSAPSY TaxID=1277257 RepID=A0A0G3I816_LIBAF|nr:membrane protein [Candidatus Liberibacter africanus]AKK19867.1 putative transmembrane protein [Candidatus Liberibacter africanus PTSAPSY]QTP63723.1 hypothetical protein HUT03_01125 [Candidatus Liberibacter africanus]